MQMSSDEVEKLLKNDGWVLKEINGSHCHYVHPFKNGKVTVPRHKRALAKGTLNSILKQAGLK